jgi:hypothetical protein
LLWAWLFSVSFAVSVTKISQQNAWLTANSRFSGTDGHAVATEKWVLLVTTIMQAVNIYVYWISARNRKNWHHPDTAPHFIVLCISILQNIMDAANLQPAVM